MQNFRQLDVWKKAHALMLNVKRVTRDFHRSERNWRTLSEDTIEVRRMLVGLRKKILRDLSTNQLSDS